MQNKQTLFDTNNATLAFALFVSGIHPVQIRNEYDDALLDKLKCAGPHAAQKMKRLGEMHYLFLDTNQLRECLAAFDGVKLAIKKDESITLPKMEPVECIQALAYAFYNQQKFLDMSFTDGVMMYRQNGTYTETIVETIKDTDTGQEYPVDANGTGGGMTLQSLNLSPAKRATLGL